MTTLFDPLKLGDLTLANRILMAPLTRCRAIGSARIPNALMATYYKQRSEAGLILTEATAVDPMGVGYPDTPGIWSDAQVQGWKAITDAVHAASGQIFVQLWHVGRISHPSYLGGALPMAPSAIAAAGHVSLIRPKTEYPVPRALALDELAGVVSAYRQGAENARRAGFDGVEVHGANGYLLDQFLQDGSNKRTDDYGGSIENRARLLLEVTDAVVDVFGKGRVGMHLAPRCDAHCMGDSTPKATFGYVAEQLSRRQIAFLCVRESVDGTPRLGPHLRRCFDGVYVANEGLSVDSAKQLVAEAQADAVAFGRPFIANPDLVDRIRVGAELNAADNATFYGSGAAGYTDYPSRKDV